MKKHKHYQQIRAYADKWDIEYKDSSGVWLPATTPTFREDLEYRIVPDEDGYNPWYAHEGAERPVDEDVTVEVSIDGMTETAKAYVFHWGKRNTIHSVITKYRVVMEDKEVKEDKPECFNNPDATWGGACYWNGCMHHLRDEPICGSLKGTNNTSTVEERLTQVEETQDVLLNKMVTTVDVGYMKRRMRRLELGLTYITAFSVEGTTPYAFKKVTNNDKGIYASGQGWDIINTKYLGKLLKLEKENEDE